MPKTINISLPLRLTTDVDVVRLIQGLDSMCRSYVKLSSGSMTSTAIDNTLAFPRTYKI